MTTTVTIDRPTDLGADGDEFFEPTARIHCPVCGDGPELGFPAVALHHLVAAEYVCPDCEETIRIELAE